VTTKTEALLRRVEDPVLRAEIAAVLQDMKEQTAFGLSFERHLPERVRLPRQALYRGALVEPRDGVDAPSGTVGRVRAGVATVLTSDGATVQVPSADLVVVRDFGQPIYPGFVPLGRVAQGGEKPDHVVIRSENFHALETLQYTHQGKIDVIYIDPPYNTGGDLIYNDRYVSGQDSYRHSKWLSFMERRLQLAKPLLGDDGVIIVAIDDNEHAHLKVLMDSVFGERNFLANIVWQGSGKNDARFGAGGLDYMLIYARDSTTLIENDARWVEPKRGLDLCLSAAAEAWEESGHNADEATRLYRRWLRTGPDVETSMRTHYTEIDEHGRVFRRDNLLSPNPRPNLMYSLLHPVTGEPVRMHPNGWRWTEEQMLRDVAEGRILFGPDHTTGASYKRFLDETADQAIRQVFTQTRFPASTALERLLGEKRFDYPKDTGVLGKWINAVTMSRRDARVLDFFGGSGSTTAAVMKLNAADGGSRQCILVTNNEVNEVTAARLRSQGLSPGDDGWEARGIFEHVTRPRLTAEVTGKRADIEAATPLAENVTFLGLDYLDPDDVRRGRSFAEVAHLLWLKAGATGPCIATQDGAWTLPPGARYGVLSDVGAWADFADAVARHDATVRMAYIITDSRSAFTQARRAIPSEIESVHLYENYLTTFTINGTTQ